MLPQRAGCFSCICSAFVLTELVKESCKRGGKERADRDQAENLKWQGESDS